MIYKEIPLANWLSRISTQERLDVVQFNDLSGRPVLRFPQEPFAFRYSHMDIVGNLADEIGVRCFFEEGAPHLSVESSYRVVGAGYCVIDLEDGRKEVRFFEKPNAYDMNINLKHLQKLRKEFPEWNLQ